MFSNDIFAAVTEDRSSWTVSVVVKALTQILSHGCALEGEPWENVPVSLRALNALMRFVGISANETRGHGLPGLTGWQEGEGYLFELGHTTTSGRLVIQATEGFDDRRITLPNTGSVTISVWAGPSGERVPHPVLEILGTDRHGRLQFEVLWASIPELQERPDRFWTLWQLDRVLNGALRADLRAQASEFEGAAALEGIFGDYDRVHEASEASASEA